MPNYGFRIPEQSVTYPNNLNPTDGRYFRAPGLIDGSEILSSGALSYLEFISVVKHLWEKSYSNIPILPISAGKSDTLNNYPAIIGYAMELRKAHTSEPKPRFREHIINNTYSVYGQKFQNIISFTVMSKVGTFQGADGTTTRDDIDTAVLCDEIVEVFEGFMQEYTPILKAAGATDLVYSRRLSDTEMNREDSDVHKRVITYMVTTEKIFATPNERIASISLDIRTWIANIDLGVSTSLQSGIDVNQQDLNLSTPNS